MLALSFVEGSPVAFRKVAADSSMRWIGDAIRLVMSNPVPFLLMGLVIGLVALVPVIGTLALAIIGPALYAGIVYATREQAAGRAADFQHLLVGFQQPGKLPRLLMLCLPGIAAGPLLAVLLMIFIGGAIASAGVSAATGSDAMGSLGLGGTGFVVLLLAMAVGIVAYAAVFFAIPRVMLGEVEPIEAMRDSLLACLANAGAFLLFIGAVFLGAMIVSLVTGWISALIAQLVATTVLIPLVSATLYFAYRDVYRDDVTQDLPSALSPPPSIEV
jgi:uncharacterized membrane protein